VIDDDDIANGVFIETEEGPSDLEALRVSARRARAALAATVAELDRLGACVDPDCEDEECWLGSIDPNDEMREALESAAVFLGIIPPMFDAEQEAFDV
jgi:hypothetical protein